MKNKKDLLEIIFLGMITILLFSGLILASVHFKKIEKQAETSPDAPEKSNHPVEQNQETKKENDIQDKKESFSSNSPKDEQKSVNNNPENNISSTEPQSEFIEGKEEDVVAHFKMLESSLVNYEDENVPSVRERAKNIFTEIVDFLFYGSTIKGYTFESLTTKTKLKIIETALKIDDTIDTHFPNYKDELKKKMTNLKGRAALLYLETTANMCESIGESACEEARNDFKNMKNSFGFTWDIIKEATTSASSSIKTILSEWYQSIK